MVKAYRPPELQPQGLDEPTVRKTIWEHGVPVTWERASRCPCRRVLALDGEFGDLSGQPGEPRSDCEVCNGRGVLYHSPEQIIAVVGQLELDPKYQRLLGSVSPGTVMITVLPEHAPGFLDRYTLNASRATFSEIVTHAGPVQALRYPVLEAEIRGGSAADDTIEEVYTVGVIHVRRANSNGIVQNDVYVDGVDFAVVNGEVDWTAGSAAGATEPDDGDLVSYTYHVSPRYVVTSQPYQLTTVQFLQDMPSSVYRAVMSANLCSIEWLSGAEP